MYFLNILFLLFSCFLFYTKAKGNQERCHEAASTECAAAPSAVCVLKCKSLQHLVFPGGRVQGGMAASEGGPLQKTFYTWQMSHSLNYSIVLSFICYGENMQTFVVNCSFNTEVQKCFSRGNVTIITHVSFSQHSVKVTESTQCVRTIWKSNIFVVWRIQLLHRT